VDHEGYQTIRPDTFEVDHPKGPAIIVKFYQQGLHFEIPGSCPGSRIKKRLGIRRFAKKGFRGRQVHKTWEARVGGLVRVVGAVPRITPGVVWGGVGGSMEATS
jgi:hypothetical protein